MFYHPDAIANIISLKDIIARYRVTMDSEASNSIVVHTPDSDLTSLSTRGGLYYVDMNNLENHKSKPNVTMYSSNISLLNIASENKKYFTTKEIEKADNARIGWPRDSEFKHFINEGEIINCVPTTDDINRGLAIYGPLKAIVQGKMTRRRPQHVEGHPCIDIPSPILKFHPNEEISTDFFYVQQHWYLLMKGRIYKFQGINPCRGRGKIETSAALKYFVNSFGIRGINVDAIHGDNEFEKIRSLIAPIRLHGCGREEHIPDIERAIYTFKERCRCSTVSLPYKHLPKVMVDANIEDKIHWLNHFTPKDYISPSISPAGMTVGAPKVDFKHLKLSFGQYCQVHDGTDNSQKARSIDAIALRPKNDSGSYYFTSLDTGRRIHSNNWTELSITDDIIAKVEAIAKAEKMPHLINGEFLFKYAPGIPVPDLDDVDDPIHGIAPLQDHFESVVPSTPTIFHDAPIPSENQGANNTSHVAQGAEEENYEETNDEINDEINEDIDEEIDETENENTTPNDTDNDEEAALEEADLDNFDDAHSLDNSIDDDSNNTPVDIDDEDNTKEVEEIAENTNTDQVIDVSNNDNIEPDTSATEPAQHTRPTRERKSPQRYEPSFTGKKYGIQLFSMMNNKLNSDKPTIDLRKGVFNVIFTQFNQMTADKGIKKFGERAVAAIFKEYKQMQDLKVLGGVDVDKLTYKDKKKALRAVNLIKLKRCGKVKGRMCANGAHQRKFILREEAKSPTVSLDGLLLTAMIAAYEKRNVVTFDIPSAFLQADIAKDKLRILKLEGKYVDIMCEVNPEYKPNVRVENGKKVLYIQILKALYGMIESTLSWYELYTSVLMKMGFELNPYDPCVANKMINGKQATMTWYVDDNMLSHVDEAENEEIVAKIEELFPGLTVTRGKEHTFI